MNTPRLLSLIAATAILAGCGAEPVTRVKNVGRVPVVTPQPGPYMGEPGVPGGPAAAPAPGAPGAGDNAQARAFIQKSMAFLKASPTYALDMHWMQKAPGKSAKGVYDVKGKAPRTTWIEIIEGNSQGTKVLFTGGSKVKVRPPGILGAITVDLDLTDKRIVSTRGYTISETDLTGLMQQVADTRHTTKLLSFTGDRAVIEATGGPLLKGCVKLVYQCDPNTGKPFMIEQFDAKEVVFRIEIRNFHALKSASFDI